jgi:hypothetical protein
MGAGSQKSVTQFLFDRSECLLVRGRRAEVAAAFQAIEPMGIGHCCETHGLDYLCSTLRRFVANPVPAPKGLKAENSERFVRT